MDYWIHVYDISNWKGYGSMAFILDMDKQMVKMEVRTKCMMKYLMMLSMVVFPTAVNAQVSDGAVIYHSLTPDSGPQIGPTPPVPAFSWQRPTWSQGGIGMNAGSGSPSGGFGGAGSTSQRGVIDSWDLE
jgi:hypothetical protein